MYKYNIEYKFVQHLINANNMQTKRELYRPAFFSIYKWFWRNSTWNIFLKPNPFGGAQGKSPAGLAFAHLNPRTHEDIMSLNAKPGVYEFAISKGSGRRYKVYIGESGSIRKRHQTYAKAGDHLVLLFDAALKDGCTIWRRCMYVKTKQKAVAWEAYFLGKYDYAWNAQQNQKKRRVNIVTSYFCLCIPSINIVEEPLARSRKMYTMD